MPQARPHPQTRSKHVHQSQSITQRVNQEGSEKARGRRGLRRNPVPSRIPQFTCSYSEVSRKAQSITTQHHVIDPQFCEEVREINGGKEVDRVALCFAKLLQLFVYSHEVRTA
jgi:hypothetical protein